MRDVSSLKKLIIIFGLLIINLVVYGPALLHPARSDQNFFIIETLEDTRLQPLLTRTFSYTRTRSYAKGDELQFKPLYFCILAAQKWLFQLDFFLWQLFSLLMHILVVYLLYRLLLYFQSPELALLTAILFSVLHISQDMVIWHHINPVFICFIFILVVFKKLSEVLVKDHYDPQFIFKISVLLGIGCLIHEYAVLMILCFSALIYIYPFFFPARTAAQKRFIRVSRSQLPILWLPFILFICWNIGDFYYRTVVQHLTLTPPTAEHTQVFSLTLFAVFFLRVVLLSIFTPFTPLFLKMDMYYTRLWAKSLYLNTIFKRFDASQPIHLINAAVLLIILFFCVKAMVSALMNKSTPQKERIAKRWNNMFIGLLALSLSFGFIAITVIGRLIPRSEYYLELNLYYFYPFILFNTIAFFSFWSTNPSKIKTRKMLHPAVICGLLLMIGLNMRQTYLTNVLVREREQQRAEMIRRLGPKTFFIAFRHFVTGAQMAEKGQYEEAIARINQGLAINPHYFMAYDVRGSAHAFLGQKDQAIADFNRSLDLKPGHCNAIYNRANTYFSTQQWDLAITDYQTFIACKPIHRKAHIFLSQTYKITGQAQKAIQTINRVLEHYPHDGELYFLRAQCRADLNEWDKSKADAQTAEEKGYTSRKAAGD